MKKFSPEQMVTLLEKYGSQSSCSDNSIDCETVNDFMKHRKMRVISREDFNDHIFYTLDGDYKVNFSLDNSSLNHPNIKSFLDNLYSQE